VKPARFRNVVFFSAVAERAGFRPCLRCRPETAPGSLAWRGAAATVSRALRLIDRG
jgi:AraC family transcriptional regulator of adaptative response / DNA-3-methyladenine glycosylase II